MLGACLFQGKESAHGGGGWDDFPNADQNLCGDITPDQMAKADSLVQQAKGHLDGEAVFLSSDSAEAWSKLKGRDLDSLDAYYSGALKAAPNHCGAIFGKAIVTAYSIFGDATLDSLVKETEGSDLGSSGVFAKFTAEGAAPALLDVRRGLAGADKSLLTLAQQVGESVLLPKLDSSIQGLERVVAHPGFRFRVGNLDQDWSVDRGEAAPLLATLKIAKSLVILVAGYQWNTELDDGYPYLPILRGIGAADLDSLTARQKEALDHYTGLLSRGSTFTHVRAGWEARTASIPALLNEAIGHVQAGLEYGILQAEKKIDQKNDPYRVGVDETSDVDPADLRDAITRLERARKYLTGEVLLAYSRDSATLRINVPKFFKLNGLQGLLPYFRFHPYEEWNDDLPADSLHPEPREKGPIYFTDAADNKTLEAADVDYYADDLATLTGKVVFPDPTMGGIFPDLTNANFWPKAKSLLGVRSRVRDECAGAPLNGAPAGCGLPVKPSDLDILVYFLGLGF